MGGSTSNCLKGYTNTATGCGPARLRSVAPPPRPRAPPRAARPQPGARRPHAAPADGRGRPRGWPRRRARATAAAARAARAASTPARQGSAPARTRARPPRRSRANTLTVSLSRASACPSPLFSPLCSNHTPLDCTFLYQWDWWTLWFEGCLLISLFVSIFFESARPLWRRAPRLFPASFSLSLSFLPSHFLLGQFNKGKSAMIIFLTLATNCLMTSCNRFITLIPSLGLTTTHEQKIATNAGAAGYTMLALFNFCLLIILGFEPNKAPEGVQNKFEPLEEIPMGAV